MTARRFKPFPQLWAEFGNQIMDGVIRGGVQFETLERACEALVTQGHSQAKAILGIGATRAGEA